MVDSKIIFEVKNSVYRIVDNQSLTTRIKHRITYTDGSELEYGDPAEVFCGIPEKYILPLMEVLVADIPDSLFGDIILLGEVDGGGDLYFLEKNEVSFTLGIEEYTTSKKLFLELSLLLCEVKLQSWAANKNPQYEDLLKVVDNLKKTKAKYDGEKIFEANNAVYRIVDNIDYNTHHHGILTYDANIGYTGVDTAPFIESEIKHKITSLDGGRISQDEPIAIFTAIDEKNILAFMETAAADIPNTGFGNGELYSFTLGSACKGDKFSIDKNEVYLQFMEYGQIISKKLFVELCLLFCEVKLKTWESNKNPQYEDLLKLVDNLKKTKAKYDVDIIIEVKDAVYRVVENIGQPLKGTIKHKITYINGCPIASGDPILAFAAINEKDILEFMETAADDKPDGIFGNGSPYLFILGDAIYAEDNFSLEKDKVCLFYEEKGQVISKELFFDLCLLLCQVKNETWYAKKNRHSYELLEVLGYMEETRAKYSKNKIRFQEKNGIYKMFKSKL